MPLSQVMQVEEAARRISERLPEMRVQETVLCRVAVILGRDLTSRLDHLIAPSGLAELEFRLLLNLFARGGKSFPGELCPALAQSPANLTRISDLLVERGLITRAPDPEDRRKLALSLTPAGEQLAKELTPQLTNYMSQLYRDFTEEDRIRFMDYLKRLVGALDALAAEDPPCAGDVMIRRFIPDLAIAALLALVAGCASPPEVHEAEQRQVAPLAGNGTAQWPDARWWRGYGDDTLNGLIEQALQDSPGLASAAARFGTANENARIAAAQAGLKLEATAEYELYRLSDNGLIPPEFLGYHWVNQSDLGIGASYTFDWWGRNRALVESATDQAHASGAEQQAVALTLAASIAQTYFGWQADGARNALLDARLVTLQEAAHIAKLREDAGLDYANDSERVRGEQAAVREQQALLRGAQRLRVIELAALLGLSPDQLDPQLQIRKLPEARAGLPANASIDLMAHRPDVVASRWRVEAAREDVTAVKADYYPDVSLHALAGFSSVDVVKLLDPGSWAPTAGFAVHLPLFDAGLRDARHGQAAAQLNAAVARYNETIVDAAREVGAAANALEQSAAQRQQRGLQLKSATAMLRYAVSRERAGITDLQPELEARLSLLREQDASIQIDYAALVADIQLQTALGGGLTVTEFPMSETTPPAAEVSAPNGKRRRILTILGVVFAVLGIIWLLLTLIVFNKRERTDDAYVTGNQVRISTQTSGTVIGIFARNTSRVAAGQVLLRLDQTDAQQAVDRASAALAQSVRQVRQHQAETHQYDALVTARTMDLQRATTDLARREPLLAERAVAEEEVRHAREAVTMARAQLEQARQLREGANVLVDATSVEDNPTVMQQRAAFIDAWIALQRTAIVAPINGYIAQRSVQLGQKVVPGEHLMSVIPLQDVWLEANFKEQQLRNLRIGQPAEITSDQYGRSVVFHGHVIGLQAGTGAAFSVLPPQNASGNWIKVVQRVPVKIALDPKELAEHPLRIGLSMTATVDTHNRRGLVLADEPVSDVQESTKAYATDITAANAAAAAIIQHNSGRD